METLFRNITPIRMRNYGRILQQMIEVAANEQNEKMQQRMAIYIARCMRQKNFVWNKDQDTSVARVKEDIAVLSNGRLNCNFEEFDAEVQRNFPSQNSNNKKKK